MSVMCNVSAAAMAAAMLTFTCGGLPTARADDTEDSVIDTCESSVKDQLKDPDSAKFKEWKAWVVTHHDKPPMVHNYHPENGDTLYSAGGMVNARNGFGGYVGDTMFGCDAAVTTDGDIHARAYNVDDIPENGGNARDTG